MGYQKIIAVLKVRFFLIGLLIWQNCLAEKIKTYQADVCVYGGTASGVMAALAAKKEGANVILIEPTRYLGGMTGGGIHHLDWGKGNTVGGSTYKMLTEGIKDQNRRTSVSLNGVGNKEYRERFRKADRYCRDQGDLRTPSRESPGWRKDNRASNPAKTHCSGRRFFFEEKR